MSKIMKFSIIICTYNKLQHLKLTLQSYHTAFQTFPYFEVIVCNDGGEDLEADYLKNYYSFDLKYIKIMHSGRPKARNTGLEAAEGDIVLFNDDDILINPECLKYHMDCHLTNRDCIVLGANHMLDLQKELFNQREPVSIITKDRLMNTSVDDTINVQRISCLIKGKRVTIGLVGHLVIFLCPKTFFSNWVRLMKILAAGDMKI